ncbi:MAG: anti-sigma factor [Bacteroidia bacterium]|nr:anti-sigma factor [Bacteroidia bacterium]
MTIAQLKKKYNNLHAKNELTVLELLLVKDIAVKTVHLSTIDSVKKITPATIYWNTTSKEVYLSWNNIHKLPTDKQYQLCAIVNGKPINIGVFDLVTSLQKMQLTANDASAFAITVEQKGGSLSSTLTAMMVMNKL